MLFPNIERQASDGLDKVDDELDEELYARHAEINSFADLEKQRGTPIPALFNQFYKFIQNPSTVSVETFKRMVDTDDTIGSGVDFLTTCLSARLGVYEHPNKAIAEWVNKALNEVDGGFQNAMKELLGATWAGFAVQEVVWANDPLGFIPRRLVSLPPSTLLFETERTGELTPDGILQYQRNYNPAQLAFGASSLFGFSNGIIGSSRNDPYAKLGDFPFPIRTANTWNYLSIRIPVAKCLHYAFDAQGKFGSPYGRSLLRRAYKWYVMKDGFLQMLAVALDRKGTPLTVVFADPNTTLLDPSKMTPGVNQRGQTGVGMRADVAAAQAFKNVHNDSTIILPGKKGQIFDLDFVPQQANSDGFMQAIDLCNKSMLRAMLVPSLIFSNGDGTGSYALGQEHAKTFDKILDGMLGGFKAVVLDQLIRKMIALNFPASAWVDKGVGNFGKVELTPDEIQKEIDILDKAVTMGAIDMNDLNDLNAIRSKIRMEPRTTPIPRPDPMGDGDDDGTPFGGDGGGKDDDEGGGGDKKKDAKLSADLDRRVATVAIMVDGHVLMGRRRDNDLWTFPGGHADPGEALADAALREAWEETGITLRRSQIRPLSGPRVISGFNHVLQVQPFVARLNERPATTMRDDPDGEVYRWQWVDVAAGIPADIYGAMHVPPERNVLLSSLGLGEAPAA